MGWGARGQLWPRCVGAVWGNCLWELCVGGLCGGAVFHSYLVSDLVHSRTHGSVQRVTLWHVPVNVLPTLFL